MRIQDCLENENCSIHLNMKTFVVDKFKGIISHANYLKIIWRSNMTCLFNMIPNGCWARFGKFMPTFVDAQVVITVNNKIYRGLAIIGFQITATTQILITSEHIKDRKQSLCLISNDRRLKGLTKYHLYLISKYWVLMTLVILLRIFELMG